MNLRLTRRRFSQLAIAGGATVGLTYLANKTFAQTPNRRSDLTLVGLQLGVTNSSDDTTPTLLDDTDLGDTTSETILSRLERELLLPTLDLVTNQSQSLLNFAESVNLESGEELTGFTSLKDGTLIISRSPASTSRREDIATRLTLLSRTARTLTVSGIERQEKLGSLVGTQEGRLHGLVARKNGTPPVRLVEVNAETGEVTSSSRINLPDNERFNQLAQCPDGKLYTTVVGRRGETSLVQLESGQRPITLAQLRFNDTVWNNGLQSLLCNNANQLIAFGAPRYIQPNALYTVDLGSGAMAKLVDFDAARVAMRTT